MQQALKQDTILSVTCAELSKLSGIRHGFFGRRGGVSKGVYTSLNCGLGSNDVQKDVIENRRRVTAHLKMPAESLYSLYQCHTNEVVVIRGKLPETHDRPKADALVSNVKGITIGILTADCTPVIFADSKAGVIGAAHAGWKGAITGVLENTVKEMEALGAKRANIMAAIGPCIRQQSYEVGPEFKDNFLSQDMKNARFFIPSKNEGKSMFDLAGYVKTQLDGLGLAAIEDTQKDTLKEADNFFSYRRTCLAGEKDYGRQISTIALS